MACHAQCSYSNQIPGDNRSIEMQRTFKIAFLCLVIKRIPCLVSDIWKTQESVERHIAVTRYTIADNAV